MPKNKIIRIIIETASRIYHHVRDFSVIWILIVVFCVGAYFSYNGNWDIARWIIIIGLIIFGIHFLKRPMNVIFGLIGTTGVIRVFVGNIIIINILFAIIYQLGFFQNAGVSYDVNQPHIEYNLFSNPSLEGNTCNIINSDTTFVKSVLSDEIATYFVTEESFSYQHIGFETTMYNTVMTSLMQEPTDLFSAAATYNLKQDQIIADNLGIDDLDRNISKTRVFHWLLNLQILISWIFFGVFISLLYNKFRYES